MENSTPPTDQPGFRLRWKHKLFGIFLILLAGILTIFLGFPRAASILLSYKRQCRVMRVEPFMKGMVMTQPGNQLNKFSVICDDGFVCRAEDTGFASVREGDLIEFRGFPEFSTIEEWGKCDHARLNKIDVKR